MQELLLVRYGEIFLKGLNRPYFIRSLIRKIRYAVRGMHAEVWIHDGRIFIRGFDDLDECIDRVTRVFGVHSVSPALEMPKDDFDAICDQAIRMTNDLKGTFKVNARRSDKRYPMNSPAINEEVGYRILNANPNLKVDVHNPDFLMNIEIRDMAYLYVKISPAVGGMPVGTNGNATLLLSGGIDSPVAGWMIAKRARSMPCITTAILILQTVQRKRCWTWPGNSASAAAESRCMSFRLRRSRCRFMKSVRTSTRP